MWLELFYQDLFNDIDCIFLMILTVLKREFQRVMMTCLFLIIEL